MRARIGMRAGAGNDPHHQSPVFLGCHHRADCWFCAYCGGFDVVKSTGLSEWIRTDVPYLVSMWRRDVRRGDGRTARVSIAQWPDGLVHARAEYGTVRIFQNVEAAKVWIDSGLVVDATP